MTRDDMQILVYYYLYDASAKPVMEDTDIDATRVEIEKMLNRLAEYLEKAIDRGVFDDDSI
ncbi:MAG: hypothetical protein AMS22_12700 [Thiotrichales bacterium SG8_50]|nr:MAG: hypothetical protein AMS22_12700 [Thiotrichales bacterium SG8_50]